MRVPIFHVDAFTDRLFGGNPAAVCPLDAWLPTPALQAIAAENSLPETAFFVPDCRGRWSLRWFTPAVEVDLCGHATLASAFVLWSELGEQGPELMFETRSGELRVTRQGEWIVLDFPARPATPVAAHPGLLRGLGGAPQQVLAARDYLVVYGSEAEVRALRPEMTALTALDRFAVIVTAPGSQPGIDFVSRFFAPGQGIPEDSATGSAHCTLIPYWAQRLGKTRLQARQVSARGAQMSCELAGERVRIGGQAVLYGRGMIELPADEWAGGHDASSWSADRAGC